MRDAVDEGVAEERYASYVACLHELESLPPDWA